MDHGAAVYRLTSSSSFKLFLSLFCHIGLWNSWLVCYSWSQSPPCFFMATPPICISAREGAGGRLFHPGFSVILTLHIFWVIVSIRLWFWPQSPAHIHDAEVNVHGRALTREPATRSHWPCGHLHLGFPQTLQTQLAQTNICRFNVNTFAANTWAVITNWPSGNFAVKDGCQFGLHLTDLM